MAVSDERRRAQGRAHATGGTSTSRTSITYTDWGTTVNPTAPADAKTFDEARSKATGSGSASPTSGSSAA